MKIRIVTSNDTDSAAYVAEMLTMWGAAYWDIGPADVACNEFPAMIIPADAPVTTDVIKTYAGQGGHAIVITPSREMLDEFGTPLPVQYGDDGGVAFLRQVQPLLGKFSRYSMEVIGRRSLPVGVHYAGAKDVVTLPESATAWAYMYELGAELVDRPAVWTMPVGKGCVTFFTYDLVECFRDLRQGRPRYAGYRSNFDDICRPSHLFGPNWLSQAQAKHLPMGDFHPMLLTRLIEHHWPMPMPRLWQLPGMNHSAIVLSGDEDGSPPEVSEEICSYMDSIDANMNIYVMMQTTQTPIEHLQQLMNRGHSFSVHPYPMLEGEGGHRPGGDILAKLEWCVNEFKKRFNLPTRTVRNHRLVWTDYMDIPRMWERLGVEADCNYGPMFLDRGFSSIYGACSGVLPTKFIDENYKLINVLQMPLALSDDAWFSDAAPKTRCYTPQVTEAFTESLIADTLKPLGTVFDVIFHPGNYVRFAKAAEQAMLKTAISMGTGLVSETEWLDFWQMRRAWQIAGVKRDGSKVTYSLKGGKASQQLSLSLPANASQVGVDGNSTQTTPLDHFGAKRVIAAMPDGVDAADVSVMYHQETK